MSTLVIYLLYITVCLLQFLMYMLQQIYLLYMLLCYAVDSCIASIAMFIVVPVVSATANPFAVPVVLTDFCTVCDKLTLSQYVVKITESNFYCVSCCLHNNIHQTSNPLVISPESEVECACCNLLVEHAMNISIMNQQYACCLGCWLINVGSSNDYIAEVIKLLSSNDRPPSPMCLKREIKRRHRLVSLVC